MSSSDSSTPRAKSGSSRVRIFFNGFALGVLCTAAGVWYLHRQAQQRPAAQERFEQAAGATTGALADTMTRAGEALRAKLETLDLTPEQIGEELARTGKIVRRRASDLAERATDAATDAYITTTVSAKIAADSELSIRNISVSTAAGRVALEGTVAAPEQLGKAVALALGTSGVKEVTSNLKVQPAK
ncbi:MAG: BON domain-containing protein [Opitutaceae bacterium]